MIWAMHFPWNFKVCVSLFKIHKKEGSLTVSNYQPISLLSVYSKIVGIAVCHRIYSYLCKYNLININKFGFRSNHSTGQALNTLIETIKKYLDNDEVVCRVFIDLQKAYHQSWNSTLKIKPLCNCK